MTKRILEPNVTAKPESRGRRPFWLRGPYSAVLSVFALFYLPKFLKKGKHRRGLSERFGRVPASAIKKLSGRKVIWVHGVSVGEVVQAFRLVGLLRERTPDAAFLVTATTTAGLEVADKLKDEDDTVLCFPADFGFAVRAFADAVGPRAVILLETEIWPNLICELSSRGIPVYVVNGRISEKAMRSYRRVRGLLRAVMGRLSGVGAQDERMRARFIELGADPARVRVTGNMKFDWEPPASAGADAERIGRNLRGDGFLFVAGSTHEGEDGPLMDAVLELRGRYPSLRFLLAPRHMERLEAIEALAKEKGIIFDRVSRTTGGGPFWLLDRMGILGALYASADAVFVGGSLKDFGGHNPVEPAYFEKPVLFGPHMGNFGEMAEEFRSQGAAVVVRNAGDVTRELGAWMRDPSAARTVGHNAKRLVLRHQGATRRNIESLLSFIDWRD